MNRYFFLLPLLLLCSITAYCQSQRLQLIEEFGNESLFESATEEPTFDAFLLQNTASAIALKYKISYNSSSLFQGHIANKSGAGNRRENYYKLNNIKGPYGLQDGKAFLQPGNTDTGKLYNLTQPQINNRSTSLSPFTLNINHAFNNTFDSVNVTVIVQCTQNYIAHDSTIGEIKFRLCLAEKEIHLKNPTGDNGIKDYFNLAWDYFPVYWNHGITLNRIWNIGQTDTLHYKIRLNVSPSIYIYDYSQLSFVGFIQDDGYAGNKNSYSVLQAAYSPPIPVPNNLTDVGIENVNTIPTGYCADSITPIYKITNYTQPAITSLQILCSTNYWTNYMTQNWNGFLLKDSSIVISFPKIGLLGGFDTLVGRIFQVNGHTVGNSQWSYANKYDYNSANNISNTQSAIYYHLVDTNNVYHSIHAGFENYVGTETFFIKPFFEGLFIIKKNLNTYWNSPFELGAYSKSSYSVVWLFPEYANYNQAGSHSLLLTKVVDLTGKTNVGLTFDFAYAKKDSFSHDTLNVQVSTDCGDHWQSIWLKSGSALATAADDTTAYFYPDSAEWQRAYINLHSLDNTNGVMLKFEGIEGGGNILYLDNINFDSNEGTLAEEVVSEKNILSLYPNPSSDFVSLRLSSLATIKSVEIYNVVGSLVYKQLSNIPTIDISALTNGLYYVKVIDSNGNALTSKFTKL
ncbi:MAG: T9SS type A sorting domain-containing protein [Chitinophagales bacterium]|nr:T9SS type A sorting domain-containing protein [Chitinophagales bacterium]